MVLSEEALDGGIIKKLREILFVGQMVIFGHGFEYLFDSIFHIVSMLQYVCK